MSYSVVEVFKTLQGEGFHAGKPAVFLRLGGCNMWNGRDQDRARDADAHDAECPLWCDTDFIPTMKGKSPCEVFDLIHQVSGGIRFVVITGGEPLLQLESELCKLLHDAGYYIAVETNGTIQLRNDVSVDWLTVSPKQRPDKVVIDSCDELKVVYPGCEPNEYLRYNRPRPRAHLFIQPKAEILSVGRSVIDADNQQQAVAFILRHASMGWRLSLQTHKVVGLP